MKLNNRKKVVVTMYLFIIIIVLDILFILSSKYFSIIDKKLLYIIGSLLLIFSIKKLIYLRATSIEVSNHIISVTYGHPLYKIRKPVLELPLRKVLSLKIEKIGLQNVATITIRTKKGVRHFRYSLGTLSSDDVKKLSKIKEFINTSNIKSLN